MKYVLGKLSAYLSPDNPTFISYIKKKFLSNLSEMLKIHNIL